MRKFLPIILLLLVSCSPRIIERVTETEKIVYKDSISYRDSIIKVSIPLEKNQAIVTIGDTSRLETSIARSEAYITKDGTICHTLENKHNESLSAVVKIPSRTIWIETTSQKEQTLTKIEYREKPLSKWKKFKLASFWWLFGGLILSLLWIFRKQIIKIL